jgi:hypothetical protein
MRAVLCLVWCGICASSALGQSQIDDPSVSMTGDARQVIADANVLEVPACLHGGVVTLRLVPAGLRSAGFRIMSDGPEEPGADAPQRMYRGNVASLPGSRVACGFVGDDLRGVVLLEDGSRFEISQVANDEAGFEAPCGIGYALVAIDQRHLLAAAQHACGGPHQAIEPNVSPEPTPAGMASPGIGLRGSTLRVADLVCDTDAELCAALGSPALAAEWVQLWVNVSNLQFERSTGITHRISVIRLRATEPDPYDSREPSSLLAALRGQWNSTGTSGLGAFERDVTLLFTGRDLTGLTVGQASSIGAICGDAFAVAQPLFTPSVAIASDLIAHELGHLWGACHCSCSFPASTMNPYITGALGFAGSASECGPGSVAQIVAHRDSRTCLQTVQSVAGCAADVNDSGVVTAQDLYDYLTSWWRVSPQADFNWSGTVNTQDVFDFLTAWLQGC